MEHRRVAAIGAGFRKGLGDPVGPCRERSLPSPGRRALRSAQRLGCESLNPPELAVAQALEHPQAIFDYSAEFRRGHCPWSRRYRP